jgi:hypothetical protein
MRQVRPSVDVVRDQAAVADWEGEGGTVGFGTGDAGRASRPLDHSGGKFPLDEDLRRLGITWLRCAERVRRGAPPEGRPADRRMDDAATRKLWRSLPVELGS